MKSKKIKIFKVFYIAYVFLVWGYTRIFQEHSLGFRDFYSEFTAMVRDNLNG